MNNKNHYFTGVLFITIGILFLLGNLGIINWSIFNALYYMWPLILVAIGVNLFFNNHVAVRILTFVVLISALVIFGIRFPGLQKHGHWNWNFDFDHESEYALVTYSEPLDEATTKGELRLDLGAGDVNISNTDEELYLAEIPEGLSKASVKYTQSHKKAIVKVEHDKKFKFSPNLFNKDNHVYNIHLNEDVQWDMDIDMGAVDADLDLNDLNVNQLDIDTGAGDVLIKLGDLSELLDVRIAAGAGDVTFEIPSDVGVLAEIDAGIHDLNLEGGEWIKDDDTYKSDNYKKAESKIRLKLELGVGDVTIEH